MQQLAIAIVRRIPALLLVDQIARLVASAIVHAFADPLRWNLPKAFRMLIRPAIKLIARKDALIRRVGIALQKDAANSLIRLAFTPLYQIKRPEYRATAVGVGNEPLILPLPVIGIQIRRHLYRPRAATNRSLSKPMMRTTAR